MAYDDNTFNTTIATAVENSFNETEENSLDVDVDIDDSFNEDDSTNDSYNDTVHLDDSFHKDSHNTDIDIDDSGNTDSYNDTWSFTDASKTDNSVNAGNREYNTGFGDVHLGGGHGHGHRGDTLINTQNTIVDQSSSNNIAAWGPVHQVSANESVVASGDDSIAAGDDVKLSTEIDTSTSIYADGDVLIDSEKWVETNINSGNTYDLSYSHTDESIDVDIDDSFNETSFEVDVDDSFNEETNVFEYTEVDVDVNAIVDSWGAGIAGDDIDL